MPDKWSNALQDFVDCCLKKDYNERWTAQMLLTHPFLHDAEAHLGMFLQEFDSLMDKSLEAVLPNISK